MLQFILGNSGSGKSYYLYKNVIEQSMEHPDRTYIVLVPEQFTMQTQKDLCSMHPRHGILNIDVLSFGRLAHRIFEEVGENRRQVLDDEGKSLILRKIAGDYEEKLRILKGNLKKQGYISEVKSVISEFTQYGIGVNELDNFMDGLEQESFFYYKLQDIRMVYEGFERYLADRYITKEEILDVLSGVISRSELLKNSEIVLDGFTGFTPVQNRLLGEMMKICKNVTVTVVMDGREKAFLYRHPYQLFALSKQMVTGLVTIAEEQGVKTGEPVYLYDKPVYRFRGNPELGFLEAELFRYSKRQYEGETRAISIHAVRNPAAEASFIAGEIRRLVREEGCRYRDIAVICSDMGTYASYLEKACRTYEVPVFMDYKNSILLNAFVEYVRSLLAMVEQNFTYPSVFRFLRTGLAGFEREEIDCLENYVIAVGMKGYKKWQAVWARKTQQTQEEELQMLNGLRVRFVEKVDALVMVLKQRKKTVRDVTEAVHTFFVQEEIQGKLGALEQRFQEEGDLALAKEYAQIYRIVIELFDKFAELLGDETISLKEYCELLDAGLEEAKVGVIPPSMDQVVIGDVERTRLKSNLKVLFFAGANDTFVPGKSAAMGLLSESDREQFAKRKVALSPGAKEQTYIQKFYLYMNLTKPKEKLILSYSKVSSDGKSLRPAYLVQDLRKLFPGLKITEEDQKSMRERELTALTGQEELIRGLRDRVKGVDESWKELYSWYYRNQPEETGKILEAGFFRKEPDRLTRAAAERLYGEHAKISVTRMERFSACAYAHFLTYGLRLSDRERYEFEAMDLGNIAHQSMERFARKAENKRIVWTDMTEELRTDLIEESVEESIKDYGNTVLYSSARNEYMIVRIKQLMKRSVWALTKQMEKSDFLPSGYELNFGSGKIDRIDTCEDEEAVYVKVTDYKTGMKSFDIVALYHGLQLQLPVYLNAALDVETGRNPQRRVEPAGVFYYRMKDPIVEKTKDDRALEETILKELRLDGIISGDDRIIEHLEHNLSGNSYLNPIGKNKDGSLNRYSKVLPPEAFDAMLRFTQKKEQELKQRIFEGEAAAYPYEMAGSTGCDYCAYRDICGFDPRLDGYEYRSLEKFSKEEAVRRMEEEVMTQEQTGLEVETGQAGSREEQ